MQANGKAALKMFSAVPLSFRMESMSDLMKVSPIEFIKAGEAARLI
jgi:hypothetical protein